MLRACCPGVHREESEGICLPGLQVGQHEVVKAVVPAAPVLIAYLGGGSGLAVAEQCAWALGTLHSVSSCDSLASHLSCKDLPCWIPSGLLLRPRCRYFHLVHSNQLVDSMIDRPLWGGGKL
jgi:hypothetical protein